MIRAFAAACIIIVIPLEQAAAADEPQGLFERDALTGDWNGARSSLKDAGVVLGATEIGEVLGVAQGGQRRGAAAEGRLELDLDVDLDVVAGLRDTIFHANAYQI